MQVPMEISFHGVDSSDTIRTLVREQANRLERFCDHIDSCRVAIERPHNRQGTRPEFRVRLDLTIAAGNELAVADTSQDIPVAQLVRQVFHTAERRVKQLNRQQHGVVKRHPTQGPQGVIAKLFDGYGFITGTDGRDIYFHANSVVGVDFDELVPGMAVAFSEEAGDQGPQASSLRIVDGRSGHRGLEQED